jgi:hypothetical protein
MWENARIKAVLLMIREAEVLKDLITKSNSRQPNAALLREPAGHELAIMQLSKQPIPCDCARIHQAKLFRHSSGTGTSTSYLFICFQNPSPEIPRTHVTEVSSGPFQGVIVEARSLQPTPFSPRMRFHSLLHLRPRPPAFGSSGAEPTERCRHRRLFRCHHKHGECSLPSCPPLRRLSYFVSFRYLQPPFSLLATLLCGTNGTAENTGPCSDMDPRGRNQRNGQEPKTQLVLPQLSSCTVSFSVSFFAYSSFLQHSGKFRERNQRNGSRHRTVFWCDHRLRSRQRLHDSAPGRSAAVPLRGDCDAAKHRLQNFEGGEAGHLFSTPFFRSLSIPAFSIFSTVHYRAIILQPLSPSSEIFQVPSGGKKESESRWQFEFLGQHKGC